MTPPSNVIVFNQSDHRHRHLCYIKYHFIYILFVLYCCQLSHCAQYVAPGECTWTHLLQSRFDVSLQCKITTISANGLNFSLIQTEHTRSLSIHCIDNTRESRLFNRSLAHLKHLRSLTIDNCRLLQLTGDGLTGLEQLHNLSIRSYTSRLSFTPLRLTYDSFSGLRRLENLDLGYNGMASLPDHLFCPLNNLLSLNLTNNQLSDFGNLGLVDPNTGKLCLQKLVSLDLSHNSIVFLSNNGVASLTNLRHLYLQHNQLNILGEISISALIHLQEIDLSSNRLRSLPGDVFKRTSQLRKLHLQNNSISILPRGLFNNLLKLMLLNLSSNEITSDTINSETFVDLTPLLILDLSRNKLQKINDSVFRSQHVLQDLFLNDNDIDFIDDNSFNSLYNLRKLVLSRNRLRSLEPFTLSGLNILNSLDLSGNLLKHVHDEVFVNSTNVENLKLANNRLIEVPRALLRLFRLQTLDLSGNHLESVEMMVDETFQTLVSLNLSSNSLRNVSRQVFTGMTSLTNLDLSRNQLVQLGPGTFDDAVNLQFISLEGNRLIDINGLFMNLVQLKRLIVSDNKITWFDYALVNRSLIELVLRDNEIRDLTNYLQINLTSFGLKYADFSRNLLAELPGQLIPSGIEVLLVNSNNLTSLAPLTFAECWSLKLVDLRDNQLRTLDMNSLRLRPIRVRQAPQFRVSGNPYLCNCTMEWLTRASRFREIGEMPVIEDIDEVKCQLLSVRGGQTINVVKANSSNFLCQYKTHCYTTCHCCDFDACDCEMMCPENCTCYYDQTWDTHIVDCSRRVFTTIPSRVPMDVTELYFDGNQISTLSSHSFIGCNKMRVMYLNNSNIHVISNRTFFGLAGLQVLHLQRNFLTTLSGFEFDSLGSVQELYLNDNQLVTIGNSTFSYLTHLQVLDLSGNRLIDYHVWNFDHNEQLTLARLARNPWSCDCQFIEDFQLWLKSHADRVADAHEVRCLNVSHGGNAIGGVHNQPMIGDIYETLTASSNEIGPLIVQYDIGRCVSQGVSISIKMPSNYNEIDLFNDQMIADYLPVVVAIVFVFVLTMIILVLLCLYRKEIQIWLYSTYGVRLFQRQQYQPEHEKLFDAFVSYCKKDEHFIAQILAPELECGFPTYRLCLRYRDLPVTGYVTEAITESIGSSHRTIVLLSDQYLRNDSCLFELKMAHQEMRLNGAHQLIVVVLDRTSLDALDDDAKICLKGAPIIHHGDFRFWEKLRFAMPPGRQQKPISYPDIRPTMDFKRAMHFNAV